MSSSTLLRRLALAGMLSATAGVATAGAQTVVVRGLAPGAGAELLQEGAAPVAAVANAAGDAILKGALTDPADVRVNLYVDTCAAMRRVVIAGRDAVPPALAAGCERTAMPGVFVIRSVSTIVVNVAGPLPTVLLRQGPYDLRPQRDWAEVIPTGLVIFGGGGFSRVHNARDLACGTLLTCPGDDTGPAFTGGATYWLTRHIGIEASYLKPAAATAEGEVFNATFTSAAEPHVVGFFAKIGAPAGRVRLYGQAGANFHRAQLRTIQTSSDGIVDTFEMRVAGWGWAMAFGMEAWVAPKVAIYADIGRAALKGKGVETGGEGRIDDMVSHVVVGLRVSLKK